MLTWETLSLLVIFIINLEAPCLFRGAKLLQISDNTKKNPSNLLPIAGIFIIY